MLNPLVTFFVALFLLGAPEKCLGDYEDEFPDITPTEYEYQHEDEVEAQETAEAQTSSCPSGCGQRRWKNDRFLENQFRDTGWPGRRDELSDQLSR